MRAAAGAALRPPAIDFPRHLRASNVFRLYFAYFLPILRKIKLDNFAGSRKYVNCGIQEGAPQGSDRVIRILEIWARFIIHPGVHIPRGIKIGRSIIAKFLSQVYTSIRGKVGGIVYTKNQFAGLIARAFTAPTNPQSDGQELIRTAFAEASAFWEALSQANRDLWDAYAATLEYSGPHGTYKLPGRQVFMGSLSLAIFLEHVSGSSIVVGDAPPVIAGFENIGAVAAGTFTTASATGIAVDIGNPNAYELVALVQRSVAYNPTKNTFDGPWVFTYSQAEDIAVSATTTIEIDTGLGTAGQAIFLKVRCITEVEPHRITNDYIVRCIAVTNGP